MQKTYSRIALSLLTLLCLGLLAFRKSSSGIAELIEGGSQVELLSIAPYQQVLPYHPNSKPIKNFVLGVVRLSRDETAEVLNALKNDTSAEDSGKCFVPHHGIRFLKDGQAHRILLCYTCDAFQLEINGKRTIKKPFKGDSIKTLNKILLKHKRLAYDSKTETWLSHK